jgi:hypothetical protein
VAVGISLHDRPLEHLNREAFEGKPAGDRIAEGGDAAAVIEIIQECRIIDGEAGGGKIGRGGASGRRHGAAKGEPARDGRQREGQPPASKGHHHEQCLVVEKSGLLYVDRTGPGQSFSGVFTKL